MKVYNQNATYGFISRLNNKYESFCSCSPYIQNSQTNTRVHTPYNACVYIVKNNKWHLVEKCLVKDKIKTFTSENLNLKGNEIAVIVPAKLTNNPLNTLNELPEPLMLKSENTWIPPRFKIGFYCKNKQVSYLGEYPARMTNWKENSNFIVSNDIRVLIEESNNNTKKNLELYLFPIISTLESLDWEPYFNLLSDKNKSNFFIEPNKSNFIKLADFKNPFKKPFELIGKGFNAIPIFVLTDNNGQLISIEHTQPPDELFWGRNKYIFLRELKSNLINPRK